MRRTNYNDGPKKRSVARRIANRFADASSFVGKRLGNATDYFEWMFHRACAGIGQVFTSVSSLIGSVVIPRKRLEQIRKQRVTVREQSDPTNSSWFHRLSESLEYFFHESLAGVGSVFQSIFHVVVPARLVKTTERVVANKTADAVWSVRERLSRLGRRFAPRWINRFCGRIYDNLADIVVFLNAWFFTRDLKRLLWSLPAVVLALPLLGACGLSFAYSKNDKVQHYRAVLADAIEARDKAGENLCFEKLSQLGYRTTERAEYRAAVKLAEEGKWNEAVERMQRLAPIEAGGDVAAHIWLAQDLMRRRTDLAERWEMIELHAGHAISLATSRDKSLSDRARLLMVDVHLHNKRSELAITTMEELVDEFPILHVELMRQYVSKQDITSALRHARQVDRLFATYQQNTNVEATVGSELTASKYHDWVMTKKLIGEPTQIVATLESGHQCFPDDEQLRNELRLGLWSLLGETSIIDGETIGILKRIELLNPNDPEVVSFLFGKLKVKPDGAVQQDLLLLLNADMLSVRLLMALGDNRSRSKNYGDAAKYYRATIKIDPATATAFNNLAWISGNTEPKRLDQAIKFANKAIRLDPKPRFYETRGQLFIRLKKWEPGIRDLEAALNGAVPNSASVHSALAHAYEQLGRPEQASAHRKLSLTGT